MTLEILGVWTVLAASVAIWTVCGAIYRLFLSPLASIPGPKLAALTSWYEFYYDVVLPGRYVFKIKEMHKQYGPILRISPREVHISDLQFLDEIYAPSSRRRNKDPVQMKTIPVPLSVGGTSLHDLHRNRRDALNPYFTRKSVVSFELGIKSKLKQLDGILDRYSKQQKPLNLSDAIYGFATDIVANFSFGTESDLLADEQRCTELRANLGNLLLGIKFSYHFPWLVNGLQSLPEAIAKPIMPPGAVDMLEFQKKIQVIIQQVLDDKDNKEMGSKRSIFYELRNSPTLPLSEKSMVRLEQEAMLMNMAGTESVAKSMVITLFHLISNPATLAKLRAELATLPPSASWTQLEQLPYLAAVVQEGNRLSFGVTQRTARLAPDETLHYGPYALPPGTPVSTTTLVAHTDEAVFPDPFAFRPERWLGEAGQQRKRFNLAFNKGSRKCIGVNLAHAEMFLGVAALARWDMALWETDHEDVEFRHDYQVATPKLDSKGVRVMVKGQAEM